MHLLFAIETGQKGAMNLVAKSDHLPSPSPAAQAFLDGPHRLFIGGAWHDATGTREIIVENPARGEAIAKIIVASNEDLETAIIVTRGSLERAISASETT